MSITRSSEWIRDPTVRVWLQRLSRALALAAGALLIVGTLRPWAFAPLGGLRVPLFGLFGWGALVGVAGLFLLLHPRPSPAPLLGIALGAAYLAQVIPQRLLASARLATGAVDSWFEPLNQLLERFRIQGLHLADWSGPAARTLGPGVSLTLWGAGLAAAAALVALLAPVQRPFPRACPACAHPLAGRRDLRYCPGCGASLAAQDVCASCHTPAEPGDRYCGQCGVALEPASPGAEPPGYPHEPR